VLNASSVIFDWQLIAFKISLNEISFTINISSCSLLFILRKGGEEIQSDEIQSDEIQK